MKYTKKVLSVLMSLMMGFTVMTTPILAESPSDQEPTGNPEATETQETETAEEEIKKLEAAPEVSEEPAQEPEVAEEPEETEKAEEAPEEAKEEETGKIEEPKAVEKEQEKEAPVTIITPEPVTYNGVTVTVSYPSDAFGGKNVTLVVGKAGKAETAALDELGVEYKAVDISFVNGKGKEVQPKKGKQISVSLKATGIKASGDFDVVHVDSKGDITPVEAETETVKEVTKREKIGETVKTQTVKEKDKKTKKTKTVTKKVKENVYGDVTYSDVKSTFTADSFSVYAVLQPGEPGDNARLQVKFVKADGSVTTILVKKSDNEEDETGVNHFNEVLFDPGVGQLQPGEYFKGWFKVTDSTPDYDNTTTPLTINDVRSEVKDTLNAGVHDMLDSETLTYKAMIFKVYHINYIGENNATIKGEPVYVKLGTSLEYTIDQDYEPADTDSRFVGWSVATKNEDGSYSISPDEDDYYPNKSKITFITEGEPGEDEFNDNLILKTRVPKGHWLIYRENGRNASYTPPLFLRGSTAAPAEADKPTPGRFGYTFDDWYLAETDDQGNPRTDEDGNVILGEKFTGWGSPLDKTTYLYAKWNPAGTAPYTVIIWQQNLENDEEGNKTYSFKESIPLTGTVGYTAIQDGKISNGTRPADAPDQGFAVVGGRNVKYTGFTFDYDKYTSKDGNTKIVTEGTTVINLYYDRIDYTVKVYYALRRGNQWYYPNSDKTSITSIPDLSSGRWNQTGWTAVNAQPQCNAPDSVKGSDSFGTGNNAYTIYYTKITGLYGSDIASQWPNYDDFPNISNTVYLVSWYMMRNCAAYGPGNGEDTVKGLIGIMDELVLGYPGDADGNYLTARYGNGNWWRYEIYFENLEDEGVQRNGIYYERQDDVWAQSAQPGRTQKAPPFVGMMEWDPDDPANPDIVERVVVRESGANSKNNPYVVQFYYRRIKNSILYMDGVYENAGIPVKGYSSRGELKEETGIIFGEELSAYDPDGEKYYSPEYEGFVFAGWYSDEACRHPYTFTGKTMGSGGITVYAKWQQVEYRIFLRSHVSYSDDPEFSMGGAAVSFKAAYGESITKPTAVRENYEIMGWFTDYDEETKTYANSFSFDSFVLNNTTMEGDDTVSLPYDQTEDTELRSPWGDHDSTEYAQPTNKDALENRYWITRKLELHAKWRKLVEGADGVTVIYQANGKAHDEDLEGNVTERDVAGQFEDGSTQFTDPVPYLDQSEAIGQGASAPLNAGGENDVFKYWVVQKWNGSEFEDTEETVLPGQKFTVRVDDYTKRVPNGTDDLGKPRYIYYFQLRAEYAKPGEPTPTHITWYSNIQDEAGNPMTLNDFTHDGITDSDPAKGWYVVDDKNKDGEELRINEGIPIRAFDTYSYPGYQFRGWARLDEDKLPADYTEEDLFLKYDPETNVFTAQNDAGNWVPVTEVAADEKLPYHDLYAVWCPLFYVYHSSDGTLEGFSMPSTNFDLTATVRKGNLYGGYYPFCGGTTLGDINAAKKICSAGQSVNVKNAVKYDGTSLKNGSVRFWTKPAETVDGTNIPKESIAPGHVFYLKEVPECYLRPYMQWVYNKPAKDLDQLYLITAVDDNYYTEIGYDVTVNNNYKAKLAASFTLKQNGSTVSTTITPTQLTGQRGYVGVANASALIAELDYSTEYTMTPYWITYDGVKVTNTKVTRKVRFIDGTANDGKIIITDTTKE